MGDVSNQRSWLIMLYLAGDNNLTEDMVVALEDLRAEGPPSNDKVVAQFDPSAAGLFTQRFDFTDFQPGAPLDHYRQDVIPETNTGNKEALISFVKEAVERHGGPGTNYLLILCGHGSGVTEDFFLRDESSMDSLTINELQDALKTVVGIIRKKNNDEAKTIDILGLDACFMGMGELAYQVRREADILISAEGLEPAFGWPYRRLLATAKKYRSSGGRGLAPADLARLIVQVYTTHYADFDRAAGRSADLAAVDLSTMDDLKTAVSQLVDSLKTAKNADAVTLAHWDAQTYKFDQYVDLHDLCIELYLRMADADNVRKACAQVIAVLDGNTDGNANAIKSAIYKKLSNGKAYVVDKLLNGDAGLIESATKEFLGGQTGRIKEIVDGDMQATVPPESGRRCIIKSGCSGFAHQHSYGIAIYFPWAIVSADYQDLEFAKETGWHEFVTAQVLATRREPRFRSPDRPVVSEERIQALKRRRARQLLGRQFEVSHGSGAIPPENDPAVSALVNTAVKKVCQADIPFEDTILELDRRFLRASGLSAPPSRYTGEGSKYTGEGSKYTGEGSKYIGEGSRLPSDREKLVKNLSPTIGQDYWPPSER